MVQGAGPSVNICGFSFLLVLVLVLDGAVDSRTRERESIFDSCPTLYFNDIEFPERVVSNVSEIMRMPVIGSIGVLFAWAVASTFSAERGGTAPAPEKWLA